MSKAKTEDASYKEEEVTPPSNYAKQGEKFHFKLNNKHGGISGASTVYGGSKFMEMRKTFQNFNTHSNKALNDP